MNRFVGITLLGLLILPVTCKFTSLSNAWANGRDCREAGALGCDICLAATAVELPKWRAKVAKAKSADEVLSLLRMLGIRPVEFDDKQAVCPPGSQFQRGEIKVDVFKARLLAAEVEDSVVQARGKLCGVRILAAVVLHPSRGKRCIVPLPFVQKSAHRSFDFVEAPWSRQQMILEQTHHAEYGDSFEGVTLWDYQNGAFVDVWSQSLRVSSANGGDVSEERSTWRFDSINECRNAITVEGRIISRGYVGGDVRDYDSTYSATYCRDESRDGGSSVFELKETTH